MDRRVIILTEMAMALALALLLSHFRLFRAPYGGSVTLAMIPIVIIGLRWGTRAGIMVGVALGFLRLMFDPYIVHWAQYVLDYPLAFGFLGLSGLRIHRPWVGITLGFAGRFASHVVTGILFFAAFAPEGTPAALYSVLYNGTFLIPEWLITVLIAPWLFRRLDDNLPVVMDRGNSRE